MLRDIMVWVGKVLYTLSFLLKSFLFYRNGTRKTLLQLHDVGDCIILGNGPSLRFFLENQLEKIKGKKTIAVNTFAESEYFAIIKPDYYFLADPEYWTDNLPEERLTAISKNLECMERETVWEMVLFLHVDERKTGKVSRFLCSNKQIRIVYYGMPNYTKGFERLKNWLFRHYLAMPRIQNVLIGCVYFSLNLGFSRVFIVGADHSWHEDIFVGLDSVLYIKSSYNLFSKTENAVPFFKSNLCDIFKVSELFFALYVMFYEHESLARYSKSIGARVINASEKTYIDAYERSIID